MIAEATLLVLAAIILVVIYFVFIPHGSTPPNSNLVRRPSETVGELSGKSMYERKVVKWTAQDEADTQKARAVAAAASHEINIIDLADKEGLPREALTQVLVEDRRLENQKDLLAYSADVEVQKETKLVQTWLQAARTALLAPYFNAEDVRELLAKLYKERDRLRKLSEPDHGDRDMLQLLDETIPVLKGDYHARIRQIALQANHGEEIRGVHPSPQLAGDSSESPDPTGEPVSGKRNRVGF